VWLPKISHITDPSPAPRPLPPPRLPSRDSQSIISVYGGLRRVPREITRDNAVGRGSFVHEPRGALPPLLSLSLSLSLSFSLSLREKVEENSEMILGCNFHRGIYQTFALLSCKAAVSYVYMYMYIYISRSFLIKK